MTHGIFSSSNNNLPILEMRFILNAVNAESDMNRLKPMDAIWLSVNFQRLTFCCLGRIYRKSVISFHFDLPLFALNSRDSKQLFGIVKRTLHSFLCEELDKFGVSINKKNQSIRSYSELPFFSLPPVSTCRFLYTETFCQMTHSSLKLKII